MSEELKDCPFCGGAAFISEAVPHTVRCNKPECHYYGYGWQHINEWQSRPIEDALRAELVRKDMEIKALDDLVEVNGELYAHTELCIRKAAFSVKITQEDDDRHNELLTRRESARTKLAEVRGEGKV